MWPFCLFYPIPSKYACTYTVYVCAPMCTDLALTVHANAFAHVKQVYSSNFPLPCQNVGYMQYSQQLKMLGVRPLKSCN